ncbi:hypothetical protein [Dysgonomonas sp. BGC7]|uniref:hypothetical protein n=1 Tax=Dysgonomonas sp. BGC7 TaxID=1658008 RepID=UPI00067FBF65|nr:hypothetical protein [Dysgonomonas sp. BGC7]MBD8389670.1 hypothetical protein [Dysgonomonas sp. BGC7]
MAVGNTIQDLINWGNKIRNSTGRESVTQIMEGEAILTAANAIAGQSSLGIRKSYATYAQMVGDVDSPIANDGTPIKLDQLVSVSNDPTPLLNGIYRYTVDPEDINIRTWEFVSGIVVPADIMPSGGYEGTGQQLDNDKSDKGGSTLSMQQMDEKKADNVYLKVPFTFPVVSNRYINSAGVETVAASASYVVSDKKYDCIPGQVFTAQNYMSAVGLGIVVFYANDNDSSFISGIFSTNVAVPERSIIAPQGATKVRYGKVTSVNTIFSRTTHLTEIKDEVNSTEKLIITGSNIAPKGYELLLGYCTNDTGGIGGYSGSRCYDRFIPIKPNAIFNYNGSLNGWAAIQFFDRFSNLISVLSANKTPDLIGDGKNFDFTTPSNTAYIRYGSLNNICNVFYKGELTLSTLSLLSDKIRDNAYDIKTINSIISINRLLIPNIIYAVVGVEKSIYLENITMNNPTLKIHITSSFGTVRNKRFYFTPTAGGDQTVNFKLLSLTGTVIANKDVIIRTVQNTLNITKTVICLGDSITQGNNLAYYWLDALKNILTPGSLLPHFSGVQGGVSDPYSPNLNAYHEGYWGTTSGRFVALNTGNPFYNETTSQIDIANYLTKAKYADTTTGDVITGIPQIDVVSFLIGFNDASSTAIQTAISTANNIKSVIDFMKAYNPECKFIVNFTTMTGLDSPKSTFKNNNILLIRQNILDMFSEMENVFIGDMGLCIDRYNGYNGQIETVSSFYPGKSFDMRYPVYTDDTHPVLGGKKEMVTNSIGVLLAAIKA